MTDRELLEMAAKAAGIEVYWNENWEAFKRATPLQALGGERHAWVPLDDDGDAFRLAVQLGIYTAPGPGTTCEAVTSFGWECKVSSLDRAGAMRRAIVEAAASVAKLNERKERDRLIGGMGQAD